MYTPLAFAPNAMASLIIDHDRCRCLRRHRFLPPVSRTNRVPVRSNLVDVFEITPQESQRAQPAVFSGQDARMARYHNILAKLTPEDGADPDVVEWLPSDDETSDVQGRNHHIKELSGESLVGTFADAVPRAA